MLAGMARATTEQSVSYGIDREQFGQPVGGFQAVKHRCADMATRAEAGCIDYSYSEDVLDPGLIRVSELWESREALAVHFKSEHMAVWAEERAGLGLSGRQIRAYDLSGETEL